MNWWKIEPKCMEQNHLWNLRPKTLVPLEPSSQNAVALGMVMGWQIDVRIGSSGFSFKQFLSDLITLLLSLTPFKFHRWVGLIPALHITGLSYRILWNGLALLGKPRGPEDQNFCQNSTLRKTYVWNIHTNYPDEPRSWNCFFFLYSIWSYSFIIVKYL